MRFPRRLPRFAFRQFLAVAALFAQFVVVIGAPLPTSRITKGGTIPFPCFNHPCGCSTSEEGWAGDCCCFTLEEKLAWAEARGIEPPPHVRATVEARKGARKQKEQSACCTKHATPACCEKDEPKVTETPAVKWVSGTFVQKCHGDGPAGLLKSEISAPPAQSVEVRTEQLVCGSVAVVDSHPFSIPPRPPVPPPRSA